MITLAGNQSPGLHRVLRVLQAVLVCMMMIAHARPLAAQSAGRGVAIALAAGPTLNDFETGGVDVVFVAGAEWRPATGPWVVVADVRYLSYANAEREHLVMPETSLQIEAALGPVRPFLGGGVGVQYSNGHGDSGSSLSANLAAGLRLSLSRHAGLRFEARGRSLDPFIGLTAGIVWKP